MQHSHKDLLRNWCEISFDYAKNHLGIAIPEEQKPDADLYLATRMRRIPKKRVRTLQMAKEFTCPPHLIAGWEFLKNKIEQGDDLYPHLSRQIDNVGKNDKMRMHWDINHFHLGTTPDPKYPKLMKGGKEVVYACVDDDNFYALAIDDHGHWNDNDLLSIVKQNWPTHQNISGQMILAENYTPEEEAALRKAGINVVTNLGGGTYWSPGGGETIGGTDSYATMHMLRFRKELFDIGRQVLAKVESTVSNLIPELTLSNNNQLIVRVACPEGVYAGNWRSIDQIYESCRG